MTIGFHIHNKKIIDQVGGQHSQILNFVHVYRLISANTEEDQSQAIFIKKKKLVQ